MTAADSMAWDACLDALSAHLTEQRRALGEGRAEDVTAFVPPAGLGPVPVALAARLRELAQENDALSTALSGACTAAARQLQLLSVLHSREPSSASFVDARG